MLEVLEQELANGILGHLFALRHAEVSEVLWLMLSVLFHYF